MILVVSVGNSIVSFSVFNQSQRVFSYFFPVNFFRIFRYKNSWKFFDRVFNIYFSFSIISSVVPSLSSKLYNYIVASKLVGRVYFFGSSYYNLLPIQIDMRTLGDIGTDLVLSACYAWMLVRSACVVVDFGTALTITVIDDLGILSGRIIAPGLLLSTKTLSWGTEQLFEVPLIMPSTVIGLDTAHAIQSGIVKGYEYLVQGLLFEIQKELGTSFKVFLTGGMGYLFKNSFSNFLVEYNRCFTLEALKEIGRIVHQRNS